MNNEYKPFSLASALLGIVGAALLSSVCIVGAVAPAQATTTAARTIA